MRCCNRRPFTRGASPNFASAYAGLADSYTLLASYGVEPAQQAYPSAKAAAQRALQLDDSLAEAHTSLGMVALYYEWDRKRQIANSNV